MPKHSLKQTSRSIKNNQLNHTGLDETHDDESAARHQKQKKRTPRNKSKSKSTKNNSTLTTDLQIERNFKHNGLTVIHSISHFVLPQFNVAAVPRDADQPLPSYPKYAFRNPEAIYVSANQCRKVDLCHRRPMAWDSYRHRLQSARTAYQNAMKSKKHVRAVEKNHIYHGSVYDLAERIYQQPDPYFHSNYDYYYSGGNLCYLPATQHILHCTGENMETLEAAKLTRPLISGEDNFIATLPINITMNNYEIFEVTALNNMTDMPNAEYLLTRQRNLINLVQFKNDSKLKIISQFRSKSIPFISMAQSINSPGTLLISSMKQHIRSYDIGQNSARMVKLFEISTDAKDGSMWNTIKPWQEHCFLYANQHELHLVDIRTDPDEWFKVVVPDSGDEDLCDHISALAVSNFKNLFYLATNHKLYCLDIRYIDSGKLFNSNTTVCRWTHQCEYAPLFLDTCRLDKNEYIALSSALADDIIVCELTKQKNLKNVQMDSSQKTPKYIYRSDCLPYQPLTLMETLNQARAAGKCLLPESDIQARIKCCVTGMSFCELKHADADGDAAHNYLMFSNSIGDVYAYTISKRVDSQEEQRCHANAEEVMDRYCTEACRSKQQILNYTLLADFKFLRKVLTCDKYDNPPDYDSSDHSDHYEELVEDENEEGKYKITKKVKSLGRWQKSLHALNSYQDALSKNLMAAWDIGKDDYDEDEDDTAVLDVDNLTSKTTTFETKVSNWLESNSDFQPPIPNVNGEPELTQTSQIVENTLETTASPAKKKTKKKHIKGF